MIELFSNDYFFYLLFIAAVPALILGLMEKSLKVYGLVVTVVFVYIRCICSLTLPDTAPLPSERLTFSVSGWPKTLTCRF